MKPIVEHGYQEPKRSMRYRFWRWLGFGRAFVEAPDERTDYAPGRIVTEIVTYFDWKDRLRIVLSGQVMTFVSIQTDVFVCRALSESKTSVLPPDQPTLRL